MIFCLFGYTRPLPDMVAHSLSGDRASTLMYFLSVKSYCILRLNQTSFKKPYQCCKGMESTQPSRDSGPSWLSFQELIKLSCDHPRVGVPGRASKEAQIASKKPKTQTHNHCTTWPEQQLSLCCFKQRIISFQIFNHPSQISLLILQRHSLSPKHARSTQQREHVGVGLPLTKVETKR